jgi:hypothetical protein
MRTVAEKAGTVKIIFVWQKPVVAEIFGPLLLVFGSGS